MRGNGVLEASEMPGRRRSIALLAVLAGLFLIAFASQADAYRAYVVNTESANVSVIDTETNKAVGLIQVGQYPRGIAVAPDGRRVYVAAGVHGIWVIDAEANVARGPIELGEMPHYIAITPDGGTAYVTDVFSSDVSSVDLQLGSEAEAPISLESEPGELAISPDGKTAYVVRPTAGKTGVTVVDIWRHRVLASIPLPMNPADIAIAPDGKTAYVTGRTSDLRLEGIWMIDTESNSVAQSVIPVPAGRIAIAPGGHFAYVTSPSQGVFVVDLNTNQVSGLIPVPDPTDVAITPDGHFAYVTSYFTNSAWAIDTRTNEVTGGPIPVGTAPFSIAIAEDLPSVRIRCPEGESGGCRLSLQALTRRVRGRAQSTVTNAKLRSKRPRLVPLKPRHRFARRIARARTVLVKETFAAHGKRRVVYRRLKLIH
jgi:YVTN family beta-propeller protein